MRQKIRIPRMLLAFTLLFSLYASSPAQARSRPETHTSTVMTHASAALPPGA